MLNLEVIMIIFEYANMKCFYCNKFIDIFNNNNIFVGKYYYCSQNCIREYFLHI